MRAPLSQQLERTKHGPQALPLLPLTPPFPETASEALVTQGAGIAGGHPDSCPDSCCSGL